ncbi:RNA-metabolising metallo-beta-lactamase [bacterium BMS3Bbin04]|nr:RNA-metabolising metallo-beta-lactamase [bacterium BMS3Bbin04]
MDELKTLAPKTLFLSRDNATFKQLMKHLPQDTKPRLFWSMWNGYLKKSRNVKPYADKHGIPIEHLHTSGHATVNDLKRLAVAIQPKLTIPVHTFHPEKFSTIFSDVLKLADGETLNL